MCTGSGAGLTQAQLADRVGVRRETLCRVERGRQFLTPVLESMIAFNLGLVGDERNDAFGLPIAGSGRKSRAAASNPGLRVVARDGRAVGRLAGEIAR